MAHYIAVLLSERGGWSVLFPDVPGCASQGDTLDEAIAMATDALAGHLAVARDYGDAIREPRPLEDIRADKAWAKDYGVVWDKAMAVPIMVRPPLGKPERVTISMDSNILREIDAYAEKRDLTRSAVLAAGAELLLGRGTAGSISEVTADAASSQGLRHAAAGKYASRRDATISRKVRTKRALRRRALSED